MSLLKTSTILIVFLVALTGCKKKIRKYTYVETDRGLISVHAAYCDLGMLLNHDRHNILDENSKPMTCKGYIDLTPDESDSYGK